MTILLWNPQLLPPDETLRHMSGFPGKETRREPDHYRWKNAWKKQGRGERYDEMHCAFKTQPGSRSNVSGWGNLGSGLSVVANVVLIVQCTYL